MPRVYGSVGSRGPACTPPDHARLRLGRVVLVDDHDAGRHERVVEELAGVDSRSSPNVPSTSSSRRGRQPEARFEVGDERTLAVLAGDDAGLQVELGDARGLQPQIRRLEAPPRTLRARRSREGDGDREGDDRRREASVQRPTIGIWARATSATKRSTSRVASGESNITRCPSSFPRSYWRTIAVMSVAAFGRRGRAESAGRCRPGW